MTLPASNTTCDIYRSGNGPPSAPDVAGVACLFLPRGRSSLTAPYYTNVLLVPPGTDLRDDFAPTGFVFGAGADKVYVPDKDSAALYRVVLVRRVGLGTSAEHKEALLVRQTTTWPTNDV